MLKLKTVTVSEKGQIAIPADIREKAGIKQGDTLVLIQEEKGILLQKAELVSKTVKNEFSHLLKHSEDVARKLWGTKADDIWDTV